MWKRKAASMLTVVCRAEAKGYTKPRNRAGPLGTKMGCASICPVPGRAVSLPGFHVG